MDRRGRDWVDDLELYENECVFCNLRFLGHKYRRCCRWCHYWPQWPTQGFSLVYLGVVTPGAARIAGFTHHARLFGLLPCYYRDEPPDGMAVEMKWRPLWLIESPLMWLWCWVWAVCGEGEPQFGLKVGKEL